MHGSESQSGFEEVDLEIVSNSWRSLDDSDGFDCLLESLDRKLSRVEEGETSLRVLTALFEKFSGISAKLRSGSDPTPQDPLVRAVTDTGAPAMVLSPGGQVVLLGPESQTYFGVRHGGEAGQKWLDDASAADFRAVTRGSSNTSYAIVRLRRPNHTSALGEVYLCKGPIGASASGHALRYPVLGCTQCRIGHEQHLHHQV